MRGRFDLGFEFQPLVCPKSHNSPNLLAQISTIGSFYSREGQSWNSRVEQVSPEVHWQRWMGKLQAYEHLPARANAMISSLFQALNLIVTGSKKKVSSHFYRYCAGQVGTVFKSLHSFIADRMTFGNTGSILLRQLGGHQPLVFVPLCFLYMSFCSSHVLWGLSFSVYEMGIPWRHYFPHS